MDYRLVSCPGDCTSERAPFIDSFLVPLTFLMLLLMPVKCSPLWLRRFIVGGLAVTGFSLSSISPSVAIRPADLAATQLISQSIEESASFDDNDTDADDTIKVGTKEILPFVSLEDSETPYGYSIEFWDKVASDLDFTTEWVRYDSVADMLAGLESGEVEVAIAGISITAARESQGFDFSYPFYRSGLQLMVRSPQANPIRSAFAQVFNWALWRPLLLVMATSAGVGAIIWVLEHKHNDAFSSDPVSGIGQGLWFSIVTLGTFGYGDVTPAKLPARIVACLWMGASFFIVADFIASLTVNQLADSSISFEDLRGEPVGVVDGTTGEDYVRAQPVKVVEFRTVDEAIAALADGKVEAVVHDQPTLKYAENNAPDAFELVGDRLTQENYGIAFREGNDELIEEINQEILTLQEQNYLRLLKDKWFGEADDSF